ncbi:hypothetical protein ACGK9R_01180 [Halomonas sp. HNIBRBA4712]|uniref:hypothetical protein n=1 Tax=Halomonas sp. HNIBRBA4712 TaxID=3373087 RepID=UPI0037453A62
MESVSLPVWLAGVSLVLGALAVALYFYRRSARPPSEAPPTSPMQTPIRPAQACSAPDPSAAPAAPQSLAGRRQHALFVIFAKPDATTDERLTEWLRGKNARFDAERRVFLIDGQKRTNPIIVANAYPPGEMPDLLSGELRETVRGVVLLVKPPIHRRRNQQMHVYVTLAQEMDDTFRGRILDGEQNPVSELTYRRILGEERRR